MNIKTEMLSIENPQALHRALEVLRAGGVIAFPTDTVYGAAVGVRDNAGIAKLYEAKQRPIEKAIPVLIGDYAQFDSIADTPDDTPLRLARRFWPGALTIVVPKRSGLPENLSQYPTVGIRMPDFAFTIELLKTVGPLATTSANLSGMENPLTAEDVMSQLGGRIDLILDGGRTPGSIPSTVIDFSETPPKILRQGAVPEQDLREALQNL